MSPSSEKKNCGDREIGTLMLLIRAVPRLSIIKQKLRGRWMRKLLGRKFNHINNSSKRSRNLRGCSKMSIEWFWIYRKIRICRGGC